MAHIGPPGYPQARAANARRNERRRAARVARKRLVPLLCPFGVEDYDTARDWYDIARRDIVAKYGEDWRVACGIIAATSPQTSVDQNGALAREVYDHWKAGTLDQWKPWLPCHRNNVLRALRGEPLSGQKVEAFRRALLGEDTIVVDTWMLRAAGASERDITSGSPKWVRITHEAIRQAADAVGISRSQAQAVIWTAYREKHARAIRGTTLEVE